MSAAVEPTSHGEPSATVEATSHGEPSATVEGDSVAVTAPVDQNLQEHGEEEHPATDDPVLEDAQDVD